MKGTYSLVFNRKKKLGDGLIEIRAYQSGKNKYISTRVFIRPDQWDEKNRKIKNSHSNSISLNLMLKKRMDELEGFELGKINTNKPFRIEDLTEFLKGNTTNSFIDFSLKELENDPHLKKSSITTEKRSINLLREFKSEVLFSDINFGLIQSFDRFLASRIVKVDGKDIEKKMSINTRDKIHTHIKKFLNLAIKKDLFEYSNNPYKDFKPKTERTQRTVLTLSELEACENVIIPDNKPHLEIIKDMFLFACYTGLRFSDVSQLTKDNFEKSEFGLVLKIKAQKTGKYLTLPLYSLYKRKPDIMIQSYMVNSEGLIFKDLTNQHVNRELKEITELAKIKKSITFHVARHTFGTQMVSKIPPAILKEIMQHSKMETTMAYTHINNDDIRNELGKVTW